MRYFICSFEMPLSECVLADIVIKEQATLVLCPKKEVLPLMIKKKEKKR